MLPCKCPSQPAPEEAQLQLGLAATCDVRAGSQAAASAEEADALSRAGCGGEDSQLEYVSASEEGFGDGDSWSELGEQREAAPKCSDVLCDAAGGSAAKERGDGEGCPRAAPGSAVAGSRLVTHADRSTERGYPHLHRSEVKGDGTQTAVASRVPRQNSGCVRGDVVEHESPSLPQTRRALAAATQLCKSTGDSEFYSEEDPLLCVCGAAKVADSQCPAPAALTSKDPRCGEQAAGESCSVNATTSLHMECCESLLDVSSKSQVNQAVDASSDFRVCFTTSRSTTARVPLLSRAVNTDITMINKFRHGSGETCARVARSVSGADPALEMGSQLADGHQDGSAAAAERHAQVKEQREHSGDANISSDRPARLDEGAVKNAASSHCQNLLQRAIEAELQVLNAHYQMCYQHCLKIYRLAWEENACCSGHRGNTFANTEMGSSILSVLGELKNNYSSMRAKIQTGTPLDALPPLSVEIKSLPTAASYIPRKLLREEPCCGWEQQPAASASSDVSQGQPQEQGMQHGRVRNRECSEYWFDAEEDFTDSLVLSEEAGRHREEQDVAGVREAKLAEGTRGCLSSAVSEGDLRPHFQKHQALEETNKRASGAKQAPGTSASEVSPSASNSSSFARLMKKLAAIHPEATRDKIASALLEVKESNHGVLRGLSIASIVEDASAILSKPTPAREGSVKK